VLVDQEAQLDPADFKLVKLGLPLASHMCKRALRGSEIWLQNMGYVSVVWNISVDQAGLADRLCSLPALVHLLIRKTWETEKSPGFLSNN